VIQFKNILCPTDFSETATRALGCATALARWYDARLTVLHVAPAFEDHVHAEVLSRLRLAAEHAGAGALGPVLLAEEGRAPAVIVSRAASLPADLIVLGTHGRGGFDRLALGSVTEKVVRTAACPVLTVPPSACHETPGPVAFRKILCGTDFSPSSLKAVEHALDLARQSNGAVTVIHALEYMDPTEPCEHVDPDIRKNRERIIARARDRLHAQLAGEARTWCDIEEIVAVGCAYKEILRRAASTGTDLIVMGAQGRGGIELMLYGSNTHHVVRAAACPVLTVRA
jgi:nucleotide-binding universal stress UspA family protein